MRKILLIVLIILLLIGAGLTIANGFELGSFKIWGVKAIVAENETIEKKNLELSDLVSVTYPSTLEALDMSSKTLTSTKEEYEEKAILVSNSKYYMQTEKYEIEFLWTRLGNYAKDNNVQIKIDVVNSSTSGLYDLKFTVAGEYSKVTDFIYDIENDSKLGFKIEDFHMSANGEGVQAAFSCKEISINIEATEQNAEGEQEETGASETTENTEANTSTNETDANTTSEQTTNTEANTTTNNNIETQTPDIQ